MRRDEENEGGEKRARKKLNRVWQLVQSLVSAFINRFLSISMSTMSLGSSSNVFPGGLKLPCVSV